MIRHAKQTGRRRPTDLLLLVALLLCPAVLHAQTNRLDTADPAEISAGTPGLGMTIFGSFPISGGPQTPICFFTVAGTSGTPLLPGTGDSRSPTLVGLQIPTGSIQEIPASAFVKGVFNATVYATANASDTCDGKTIDFKYTNVRQIPIQEPEVLSTDLDTLTARNTSLGGDPAPREIYLQGTDFVPGEASVTFSGSGFSTFAGTATAISSISARVDVPANLPAGAKAVALTYCTHTSSGDYCASPVTYPIQQLAPNPGTLTATPSSTTPTTPTSLQAVFGSTDGFGVPSGAVTFTDGTTTLDSAPLIFTSGQFVATNPPSAAPSDFEGSPQSIVADLNHDGLQDVILYAPNTVQIYYAADNLGGLGFAGQGLGFTGVEFALDSDFCLNVVSVTTGDFNNDGFPDIAMLCTDPASGGATDNVLVYLNQKDGTFAQESAIFAVPSAHLIAAADFNKDGSTDILLIGPDGNTDPSGTPLLGFNIYQGDGAGDFGGATTIDVPLGDGVQVAALDFNNDGFPDIALLYHDYTSDLSTSQIEVFQNDGTGNFPTTATYSRSLGDTGATFQFFTPTLPGSPYPNLVAVSGGINSEIGLVFNNQTPNIGFSDTLYTTPVPGLLSATMGDFNGDGFQDVAVYDGTNLSVYNADTLGQYIQPLASFTMPGGSLNMLLGSSDANGDGYSDPIAFITPSDGSRLVQQYITSGTATAELDNLTFAAGSHSLTATTPGTPTIGPGTATATLVSTATEINVSNAVLTTSPASPTTYAPSNPVTLTVEVDSLTAPAPTGLIQFINSLTNQPLGSVALTPASSTQSFASLPIGTQTAGNYSYSATYSGDTNYFGATIGAVGFQVNQATPVVSFVPNPATITFGTALSTAQLDATATLGGSAVAGSFVYTNASGTAVDTTTVLPGGNNNITATFTPTDTTDYKKPAGVTSTITVNQATPVVAFAPNPATLASGTPLTAAQLDATATFGGSAVAGSFAYTNASGTAVAIGAVLPAGANVITASFTPSSPADFNKPAAVQATITLSAATTTLAFVPNPATITFGTALSAAQLDATATSGGSPVAGTFAYTNASGTAVNTTTVLPTGPNAITVNFTPTDTTSFTTPAGMTSTITVNKATPAVSWTAPAAISFGTALSGTQLDATASFNGTTVAGTFSYNPASGTVLTAGMHTLGVTFTPTDGTDFTVASGSTSITVGQSTPTITWATPAAISYGTALSGTQLDATASFNGTAVAGTFSYSPAVGTVLTAGTQTLGVTFTPTDATDFAVATGSVNITVGQSTPTITWANPAAISYGTALSGTQLNATATFNGSTVAGTFSYNPASGTVLTAGPHSLGVTFTPTDATDFAVATGSVSISVGQSTPTITWATPTAISYGTALSGTQLNATATFNGATVAGTFSYNPASGTILTAGPHSLGVTFTPTDTTDFAVATGSVSITVGQSTPTITWANPAAIAFGTGLSATQLNATASFNGTTVAGTFSYNPASGTVLTAGTHPLGVTFTPTDTTDFAVATGSVNITVGQSTPTITWATPAAIAYGTALSGTQLDATASFNGTAVAGTFSYNPTSGTVLTAGTHTLGVTFTPTDTTDFAAATGSVSITVGQSTPTIIWATPAAISYGTTLSGTQLNATATFNGTTAAGTFSYSPAFGTVLTAGTHSLGVTFTPTDGTDFTVATGSVSITVGQSTPTITWATPAAISYGTALSATQLNATAAFNGSSVAGTFSYTPVSGTVLTAGTHTLGVTFTPTDATDFAVATGSVGITVGQSTPTITWATPAAISYGTALSATQLNATAAFNGASVAGTFSYNPVSGTVLTAGTHTLGVTFTPTDITDFAVATGSTSISVGQSIPVITWAPPAAINLGTALSATQLNASATGVGGAALPGTFTYLPAAGAVLPVGANNLGVTFTPTDTVDYKTTAASVPLTVNPALTTTTVTSSANPAQFGQLVTFTVGVTSAYSGATITGPVSVFDGATLLGTVQLPNLTVSTSTLSAGTHNVTAVYGGNANFGGSPSGVLAETISSATTVITWPQPASAPYGTKLSATQLNATVSTAFAQTVPGTFTYTPAAGALLTAGSQTLSVLFTPTDTASFKTATATVTLVVTKVAPTLNWAAPANITAGTPLGATQLNATATDIASNPLPGVFTYTPASGTVLAPGATTLGAAFAPTDTVDYTTANISVPLNVDAAVTTVAVTSTANPSQFGQPVTFNVSITSAYTASPISGTVTISDGKTVLGTPTLTNGAATFNTSALTTGAHNITANFAGNPVFAAATSPALPQTVNLATTTITWPTPAGISYGTLLSATQLNATVATAYATTVPGTFVYTLAAGTLLTAGTQTLSVTFTPTDTANFKPATGSITIAVGKTAPTITWPTPADVVAGTTLSATQLNATATGISGALPGTFAYTPALGTVLAAGTQTLSVAFTPTDVTDYTTATATVPLNVIGLALTSLSTASVKLGDPALNLTLTGTGFLPNSVVYVGATALTTTFVNPTSLTVTISASNFVTAQTLQITVNDPTQAQTSNALAILVGAPPATITVNGPATVAPAAQPNLTFTITPYAVPIAATLTLTFTPAPGLTTDGTILFPNGTTTTTFTIPANTTTIPPQQFQSGSVAGTIVVTLKLTAGGVDVTPTPAPTLVITSPAATPGVAGVTLDRSGDTLTVTIQGYSNTRDIEQIHFHFVAAPGQSLATSDLVIDGTALFNAWYVNPASPTYGSTFHYIQVFNLDQDATVVGQVQVTLVNSQGNSQTVSAQ